MGDCEWRSRSRLSRPWEGRLLCAGERATGLSLRDQDDELSAISGPESLCVCVIMKEPGHIAAEGEKVYILKEQDGAIFISAFLYILFVLHHQYIFVLISFMRHAN